jgi:hypothetical protein
VLKTLPKWVIDKLKPEPRPVHKEEKDALAVMWDGQCKYIAKKPIEIDLLSRKPVRVKLPNGIVIYSKWYRNPPK